MEYDVPSMVIVPENVPVVVYPLVFLKYAVAETTDEFFSDPLELELHARYVAADLDGDEILIVPLAILIPPIYSQNYDTIP